MYNNDAQRCLTGEVRLSYVSLDKPRLLHAHTPLFIW